MFIKRKNCDNITQLLKVSFSCNYASKSASRCVCAGVCPCENVCLNDFFLDYFVTLISIELIWVRFFMHQTFVISIIITLLYFFFFFFVDCLRIRFIIFVNHSPRCDCIYTKDCSNLVANTN